MEQESNRKENFMIDFQYLGQQLANAGLTDKPVNQYSKEEVITLVQTCIDSLRPEKAQKFESPWIDEQGNLHIPFNSDPRYWWWHRAGQSIYATLRELEASEEVFQSYLKKPDDAPF